MGGYRVPPSLGDVHHGPDFAIDMWRVCAKRRVRVGGSGFGVQGLEFRVWGLGFRVWSLGFGVWGLGFGVQGLEFRI